MKKRLILAAILLALLTSAAQAERTPAYSRKTVPAAAEAAQPAVSVTADPAAQVGIEAVVVTGSGSVADSAYLPTPVAASPAAESAPVAVSAPVAAPVPASSSSFAQTVQTGSHWVTVTAPAGVFDQDAMILASETYSEALASAAVRACGLESAGAGFSIQHLMFAITGPQPNGIAQVSVASASIQQAQSASFHVFRSLDRGVTQVSARANWAQGIITFELSEMGLYDVMLVSQRTTAAIPAPSAQESQPVAASEACSEDTPAQNIQQVAAPANLPAVPAPSAVEVAPAKRAPAAVSVPVPAPSAVDVVPAQAAAPVEAAPEQAAEPLNAEPAQDIAIAQDIKVTVHADSEVIAEAPAAEVPVDEAIETTAPAELQAVEAEVSDAVNAAEAAAEIPVVSEAPVPAATEDDAAVTVEATADEAPADAEESAHEPMVEIAIAAPEEVPAVEAPAAAEEAVPAEMAADAAAADIPLPVETAAEESEAIPEAPVVSEEPAETAVSESPAAPAENPGEAVEVTVPAVATADEAPADDGEENQETVGAEEETLPAEGAAEEDETGAVADAEAPAEPDEAGYAEIELQLIPEEAQDAETEPAAEAEAGGSEADPTDVQSIPEALERVEVNVTASFEGELHYGSEIVLTADVDALAENYDIIWQYSPDGGLTICTVENASELTYSFVLSRENAHYSWRAVLTRKTALPGDPV